VVAGVAAGALLLAALVAAGFRARARLGRLG
jgi:predicted lysophospholipase L1 biosynthesis ABC-type transport system permease subunit